MSVCFNGAGMTTRANFCASCMDELVSTEPGKSNPRQFQENWRKMFILVCKTPQLDHSHLGRYEPNLLIIDINACFTAHWRAWQPLCINFY